MEDRVSLINTGIYPIPQAARLAGVDVKAVRRWMLGYSRKGKAYPPLWTPQVASDELPEPSIGFRDLLELRLVAGFERHGVGLGVIRSTVEVAREAFGMDYPLTSKRFRTDGKRIFMDAAWSDEDAEGGEMLDVSKRQLVFANIIRPSLYAGIDYDGQSARRWYPLSAGRDRRLVVLDPAVQFGSPIVSGEGVPTETIRASFEAEGRNRIAVARIFCIEPRQVDAAVRFEEHLLAA